jgi:prolipoprotein diacylglyceryltransferase
MAIALISYPVIGPVAFHVGPFPIRWYALSYIGGLGLGWLYVWALIKNDRLWGNTSRPRADSIANFIKPELWGRPSDVPWAMIFPGVDDQPRHPSQLYEAGLEGLLLFLVLVLVLVVRSGALKRPGIATGIFCIGYGVARIISEIFRAPDPQLEQLAHGLTMGMVLSAPLVLIGAALIVYVCVSGAPKERQNPTYCRARPVRRGP